MTSARLARWAARQSRHAAPAAHIRALSQLEELGPCRIGELATADRCSQPTVSALVRRLEDDGLVQRLPDPEDSRACLVALTPQGHTQLAQVRRTGGEAIGAALRELDPDELDGVARAVGVFRRILATSLPTPDAHSSSTGTRTEHDTDQEPTA